MLTSAASSLQNQGKGGAQSQGAHAGNGRQSGSGGAQMSSMSWPSPMNAAQAAMNAFSQPRGGSADGAEARKHQ